MQIKNLMHSRLNFLVNGVEMQIENAQRHHQRHHLCAGLPV